MHVVCVCNGVLPRGVVLLRAFDCATTFEVGAQIWHIVCCVCACGVSVCNGMLPGGVVV